MNFDRKATMNSKRALRVDLAAQPLREKLLMLDALRERETVIRAARLRLKARNTRWLKVKVGDALRLINGRAFKPAEWSQSGLPIVRIQNLNNPNASYNYYERDLPQKFAIADGDLLFAWSGTPETSFGAHIWRGGRAWLNQHIFKVIFDETQFDKRFLQLAINQNLSQYIRAAHGGAGLAHITKGRFEESVLPVPDRAEQQRLVAEIEKQFTRLDAAIAALKRIHVNLKRYRAAVLKAACEGRLLPTEAELQRTRRRNAEPILETGEQRLWRILDDRHSNLSGANRYRQPVGANTASTPRIPEGWTLATIDQLSEVGTGATPRRTNPLYYAGGTIPWITSSALNESFVTSAQEFVTQKALAETNLTIYPPGTLLVAMYGEGKTRGKCAELRIEATTNQAIAAIQCAEEVRDFVKLSLWRQYEELRLTASGGVQPNLNLGLIRAITLPLPPLHEQKRIVAEVERRLSIISKLETMVAANFQRAAQLRNSILQRAFSGSL